MLVSHAGTSVVGNNCLITQGHNRPVYVHSYDPWSEHKSAKTVDAAIGYNHPITCKTFILMLNQVVYLKDLMNHLICLMKYHFYGDLINNVLTVLAEDPTLTAHHSVN